jgi:outer membrane protein assembly factor BamB
LSYVRPRTIVALAVLLVVVGGVAIGGVVLNHDRATGTSVSWVSETASDVSGNHHIPAVAEVDGRMLVYAPVSGRPDTEECRLAALYAENGSQRWSYGIPPSDCAIHAVADPTVADYDDDGRVEVLAATTEEVLAAYDPLSGTVEFEFDLTSYGYTQPVVADVTGDDRPEIVVVDVRGTVFVVRPNGTTAWSRQLDSFTWEQPAVADFDGDGRQEVAVAAGGAGKLHLFDHDGAKSWDAPVAFESSLTWMATGQGDGDSPPEIVTATALGGTVAMVEGNGTVVWERDLGSFAAVNAVADGDGDGRQEVYATAKDGTLSSLDARTGETEWETTLTTADLGMMPPPSLGDIDGDERPELVAPTNDGLVSVVDPRSGAVVSTYEREDTIFTHPRLADVDSDGDEEAFVMYGRGRVVAFDFERD